MIQKKIEKYMNVRMGIAMSLTMSLIGSFLGSVFFSYILPNVIKGEPTDRPVISVVIGFFLSFLVSFAIATALALLIGKLFSMKKMNDAIEKKHGKGFKTHFLQALGSDAVYTIIISLVITFAMTALFSMPNQKTGYENAIKDMNAEMADTQTQLSEIQSTKGELSPDQQAAVGQLNGKIGGLTQSIAEKKELLDNLKLVPTAAKSFATSFPLEFIIALIVIFFLEPKFQKKAFAKYIPGYGDDNIEL